MTKHEELIELFIEKGHGKESVSIELDDHSEARLVLTKTGVVVKTDHGREFSIDLLSEQEIFIFKSYI